MLARGGGGRGGMDASPLGRRRNNGVVAPVDATPSSSSSWPGLSSLSSDVSLESLLESAEWSCLPPMRQRRSGFAAAVSDDGRYLYVAGGVVVNGGRELSHAEVLDLENGRWEALPPLQTARQDCAGVWLSHSSGGGGLFVVTGGYSEENQYLDSVEAYDSCQETWISLPKLQQKRRGHAATMLLDGESCAIYVLGGNFRSNELKSVEYLDCSALLASSSLPFASSSSFGWTTLLHPMKRRRNLCAAVTLLPRTSPSPLPDPDEKRNNHNNNNNNKNHHAACVMVLGGADSNLRYASVECWDTNKDQWVSRPWAETTEPPPRFRFLSRWFATFSSSSSSRAMMNNMSQAREGLTAVSFSHGPQHPQEEEEEDAQTFVVVLGGSDGASLRERVEVYHVQRNEWHSPCDVIPLPQEWQDTLPTTTGDGRRRRRRRPLATVPPPPQLRFNGAAVYLPPLLPHWQSETPETETEPTVAATVADETSTSSKEPPSVRSSSSSSSASGSSSVHGTAVTSSSTPAAVAHGNCVAHRIVVLGGRDARGHTLDSVRMLTLHLSVVDPPTLPPAATPSATTNGGNNHKRTSDLDPYDPTFFQRVLQLNHVVLHPKLMDLASLIANVHHMKLFYTAVANLCRMGLMPLDNRNFYIAEALKRTAKTVTAEEQKPWNQIIHKAQQDGILHPDAHHFYMEEGGGASSSSSSSSSSSEGNNVAREPDFCRFVRRVVHRVAQTKEFTTCFTLEGTLESLAASVQLLESKMEKVNCTNKKTQVALRRYRKVEAGVAFLCVVLNAVSMEQVTADETLLGSIVDYGDWKHMQEVAENRHPETGTRIAAVAQHPNLREALDQKEPLPMLVAAAAVFQQWLSSKSSPKEDGAPTPGSAARREAIQKWLLELLPTLEVSLLQEYVRRLDQAGFDTRDILDDELGQHDIEFMEPGHQEELWSLLSERRSHQEPSSQSRQEV